MWWLGAIALGVVAWAASSSSSSASAETGAARSDTARAIARDYNRRYRARQRSKAAAGDPDAALFVEADRKRLERQARSEEKRQARRRGTSCCDAESDSWKSQTYRDWIPPVPIDGKDAYRDCFNDSVRFAASGDYSKPADRRCTLGKMHASKLAQWKACREECGDRIEREYLGGDYYLRRVDGGWAIEILDRDGYHTVESYATESRARGEGFRLANDIPF